MPRETHRLDRLIPLLGQGGESDSQTMRFARHSTILRRFPGQRAPCCRSRSVRNGGRPGAEAAVRDNSGIPRTIALLNDRALGGGRGGLWNVVVSDLAFTNSAFRVCA